MVNRILDAVGWRGNANLAKFRLLEPAAGDGAFIVEAARRLVASCVRYKVGLKASVLIDRIRGFELHRREALLARKKVVEVLVSLGVHGVTAKACARSWVVNADFLLTDLSADVFTHAVGNPPYVRWSKIPFPLKTKYDRSLPPEMTGGDLFLPFLDRALESLGSEGRCGFLCSDRWRFMAFAEAFRRKWFPRLQIHSENSLPATDAFIEDVDSYPTILIASKKAMDKDNGVRAAKKTGRTLAELGCTVKVGPALGHTPAYILRPDEHDVEENLLRPWVDGSEIEEGNVVWRGRRVIVMYGEDGRLVQPGQFPLLLSRLERFREKLKQRSIVTNGAKWFRPIDKVRASDWKRPKLLVPELAKVPRVAIDRSGAIPSHGVYAIFAPDDDIQTLYEKLRDGKLAAALNGIAPKVKGGYVRCYRRFLLMMRI